MPYFCIYIWFYCFQIYTFFAVIFAIFDVIASIKSIKRWVHLRKSVMLRLLSRPACEVVQGRWRECRSDEFVNCLLQQQLRQKGN